MKRQYRSSVMAAIHETAEDLFAAGVMDKRTMREFDEACLTRRCLPGISTSPPVWSANGSAGKSIHAGRR